MLHDKILRDAIATDVYKSVNLWAAEHLNDGQRKHLGASVIGDLCSRKLWYSFRWFAKPFSREEIEKVGQKMRLFNRGHREEESIVSYLQSIGFQFEHSQENQLRIVDHDGHFGGSLDNTGFLPARYGCTEKILFEFKTANDQNFKKLQKEGVKLAQPKHWTQVCTYGYKTGIRYCLYVCVNKDNDELYIDLLELDFDIGAIMVAKAKSIIYAQESPPPFTRQPTNYACKWCDFKDHCHYKKSADRNCRSCRHASAVADGQWYCDKHKGTIPETFIPVGCEHWKQAE